ncbi:MAG: phosphotransferase [Butyrivibrio sp.]|nr:phosphotransferase [Butyrivibrio sp.]
MRTIDVGQLNMIGKGVTATVYLLDEKHIVKIFRDVIPMKEIQYEYDCAKLVERMGIQTPCAREIVNSDQGIGIIYDRVKGNTLSDEMQKDKSKLYEYGVQYGHIVKSLHERKLEESNLPSAKDTMKNVLKGCVDCLTDQEIKEIERLIDLVPFKNSLLHGDIAPVNIMVEDGQLYIIDVPMIMVGNPLFDLLQPYSFCVQTRNLYEYYLDMPEDEKMGPVGKYLARFQGRYLNKEESQKVWDGFVKGYFGDIQGEKRKNLEFTLRVYYALRQIGSAMMRSKFGDEVVDFCQNRGKNWIREHKDQMDRLDYSLF